MEERDGEQAERPGADDRDRHARHEVDLEQPLCNACSRLEHCGRVEIGSRRQLVHELSGNREEVRERAGVREPGLGIVGGAEVRPAFAAPSAVAAGTETLCDDNGSLVDVLDTGPDGLHRSCPFMAGDDRIAHVRRRPPPLEHLDVGTADTGGADAHKHFAGTWLGARDAL